MHSIEGTVIFAQESRFQLVDGNGVAHQFILSKSSAAEPDQLPALQHRQARVKVNYRIADGMIARIAETVSVIGA